MLKIEDYLFKDNSVEAKRERIKSDLYEDGEEIKISGSSNGLDGTYIVESNKEKSISLFCEKHKTFISEVFRKSISQCSNEIEGETLIVKAPNQTLKEIIGEKANEKDLRLLEDYFVCFYSQVVVEAEIVSNDEKVACKIWEIAEAKSKWNRIIEPMLGENVREEAYKVLYEQKPIEPAKGEALDVLGQMVGISKESSETETEYRERLLLKMDKIKRPKIPNCRSSYHIEPKENFHIDEASSVIKKSWAFLEAGNEAEKDEDPVINPGRLVPKFEGKIQGFEGLKDGDAFNLHRPRNGQSFIENELQKFKEDDRYHGDENKMFTVNDCYLSENSHMEGVHAEIDSEGDIILKSSETTIVIYGEEVRQLKKFLNENIHDDFGGEYFDQEEVDRIQGLDKTDLTSELIFEKMLTKDLRDKIKTDKVYVGVDKVKEVEDKTLITVNCNDLSFNDPLIAVSKKEFERLKKIELNTINARSIIVERGGMNSMTKDQIQDLMFNLINPNEL